MSEVEDVKEVTYSEDEYGQLKGKVDEFRSTNVKLMKDIENLTSKFEGIDVDSYNEMSKNQQAMKDKKLISEGKIDELLEERTKTMRKQHNDALEKMQGQNGVLNKQLETLVIDNAVRDNAIKSGVVDTAIDDILLRSQAVFSLKEGQAIPHDRDGNVIYGEGTTEPMTVKEWIEMQVDIAPHLFKSSTGSGSTHGSNVVGTNTQNLSPLGKLEVAFAK